MTIPTKTHSGTASKLPKLYYISESSVIRATNNTRPNAKQFPYSTSNANHKVWLKPTSEMSFLYANLVLEVGWGG
ncbi:hypothetical protein CCACVL1_02498 [Corchorus capsularis]|uniref:Uncharacterized protein n=1 Tax=Corchorus capsularis TaxID=210143 RepID=A0A1R3K824_COCAP|nr:hypothetical protein CCACVL1_02498 [Corchorus capsularis]